MYIWLSFIYSCVFPLFITKANTTDKQECPLKENEDKT